MIIMIVISMEVNAYMFQIHKWLLNHQGRIVTEADIAEIFTAAYGQAATLANAESAYQKTGINPFDPHIFTDVDFLPSDVTDIPFLPPSTSADVDLSTSVSHQIISTVDLVEPSTSTSVDESTGSNQLICGFIDLIPIPKNDRISTNSQIRRAVAHASVVTNSPYKLSLEVAKDEKMKKQSAQSKKSRKKPQRD